MIKRLISLYALVCLILFATCEKDDVCSKTAPVTPRLVIRFYNLSAPSSPKAVEQLNVTGEGNDGAIKAYKQASVDSIVLPLKIFKSHTSFKLTKGYTENGAGNTDILNIDYSVAEQFLYRGCGVITRFKNMDVKIPLDDNNWIKAIEIKNRNVDNELKAQIKIYY